MTSGKKTWKKYPYRATFTDEDGVRHDIRANSELELGMKLERARHSTKPKIKKSKLGDITLNDWALKCIKTYKTSQNEDTRRKYINRVKHCILEDIGRFKLRDIRPIDCQTVMNQQLGMSKTQINEVYQAFHFIFKQAVIEGLIEIDPTVSLTKPKAEKSVPRRALTPEERKYVIEVGKTDRRYYLFLLMLFCGCRPGEAAECMGRDISVDKGIPLLHIRGTKRDLSDRKVPIPAEFYAMIKNTRKNEYIAESREGRKLKESGRIRVWKSFKRALNIAMGCEMYRNQLIPPYPLADDLVPYCFRHEYCTELARCGVDVRQAQLLMGHSDISLTANIYTNLTSVEVAKEVAETLDGRDDDNDSSIKEK